MILLGYLNQYGMNFKCYFRITCDKNLIKETSVVSDQLSLNLQHFIPIQKCEELILPPPPQFKENILKDIKILLI